MKKKEFHMVFQLSKTILFEVHYYTEGSNKSADFSTEAELFVRNKKDFERCGQCQRDLLVNYPEAMAFYKKWDVHHCKHLSDEAYSEMVTDLAALGSKYNYLLEEHTSITPIGAFYFEQLKNFSMLKPKSSLKTARAQLKNSEAFDDDGSELLNRPIVPFFNS